MLMNETLICITYLGHSGLHYRSSRYPTQVFLRVPLLTALVCLVKTYFLQTNMTGFSVVCL